MSRLAALGAALVGAGAQQQQPSLPYWAQPLLDPFVFPYGGASLLNGTTWSRLYYATPALGTYAMSPMLSYLNGQFLASWKLSPENEDQPGQKVMWSMSTDGVHWTSTDGSNVLFPGMNSTQNPNVALFAEPSLFINGRVYAAASPKQFCLYPDQYQDVLLLRRVYDDAIGHFGPIFWAAPTIPAGYEMASAAHNVTTAAQQDAQTQADIATLTPNATALPCQAPVGTTKCEACAGGCQPWSIPLNITSLENERSHYRVPAPSTAEVILYRSHNRMLYASVRAKVGAEWSVPVPTNITDDVANFNAGTLPDGRVYLVSNAMLNVFRDPIFLSTSADGWAFDKTAAIGSCEQTEVFANPPEQPWGCLYRNQGGAKEGGLQYPQAVAVTDPAVSGLYVIVSQNKEDIWVGRVPLASLP